MTRSSRRGLALLVVVGVLGVLALLAVAFVTLAQLERKSSQQRVNATRATLLARSGLEDALARLSAGQDPEASASRYGGEDWDADGILSAREAAGEVYRRTGAGTPADTDACPLGQAMRPNFCVTRAALPDLLGLDGRERGYTGALAGAGGTYALKVFSGGIFVNGGDPSLPALTGYNAVLRRILGTLAEALDRQDGANDIQPVDQVDGERLIDLRPNPSGWQSWDQVRDLALGGSQAKLDALRPYLALRAWTDPGVIAPNATAAMAAVAKRHHSWGEIKLEHTQVVAGSRAPGLEPRAPVELSWARNRRPVLVALMAGLQTVALDESSATQWDHESTGAAEMLNPIDYPDDRSPNDDLIGKLRTVTLTNTWLAADPAQQAADAFLACTGGLGTWQDFAAFCDTLFPDAAGDSALTLFTKRARRDLLKANFNPNTDLNKFNPNPSRWKTVDKSDLLAYSTEFSLFPIQPRDLESLGRVTDAQGHVLAFRRLTATLSGPAVLRLSSQQEFMAARSPDQCFSLSQPGPTRATWGSRRVAAAPGGLGLQGYPEPVTAAPAAYDGNLQLSTLETRNGDLYDAPTLSPPTAAMTLLGTFDDGFDLEFGAGGLACQPDVLQVTAPEVGKSLLDAAKPNTLFPDGAYSEKGRAPGYLDFGNCEGFHGVLSLWAKPNYTRLSPTDRLGHPFVLRTNQSDDGRTTGSGSTNQFFFMGDVSFVTTYGLHMHFENQHSSSDQPAGAVTYSEHNFASPNPAALSQAHVWELATMAWDFRSPVRDQCARVLCNDGQGGRTGGVEAYWATTDPGSGLPLPPAGYSAQDITLPDLGGPHLLVLGSRRLRDIYEVSANKIAQGADATFDELAIYDFGGATPLITPPASNADIQPASPSTFLAVDALASSRYREGRYYKGATYAPAWGPTVAEQAGSWLSAPLSLPKGALLRKVCWTWYRPSALPDDYAEVELLDAAASGYLWSQAQSRSTLDGAWTAARQDWAPGRSLPGDFRLRVVFRRLAGSPTVDDVTPILDSPVLDDLTLCYTPPGGARLLTFDGF